MYKKLHKIIYRTWIVAISLFLRTWNNIFASDILSDISSVFSKYAYNRDDSYLKAPYSPTYSKDPFSDKVDNLTEMEMITKAAGVQQIKDILLQQWCSLKDKEIRWILYFYSEDFRWWVATQLKWAWKHAKNILINEDKVQKYCNKYYNCITKETKYSDITSETSENPLTNCKEFFLSNYNEWKSQSERFQDIETAELWKDKYRNATVDDSPYDIMKDIETIWMLLYKESEKAITPVLYHLPMFYNYEQNTTSWTPTKNTWTESTSSDENSNGWTDWIDLWDHSNFTQNWTNSTQSQDWVGAPQWGTNNQNPEVQSQSSQWDLIDEIDYLIDWLRPSYNIFNSNSCDEPSTEPEGPIENPNKNSNPENHNQWTFGTQSNGSNEGAKGNGSNGGNGDTDNTDDENTNNDNPTDTNSNKWPTATTPDEIEKIAEDIKDCFGSCENLNIDQKASCMIMCACWETTSHTFDPEIFPWLWPIFKIRYCTIPATNTYFSVWWTKIVSIEEWINEINWVVEKLSREWKLWTWTQQYNFLDSSTKNMNFADTFAFSINAEFVDIWKNHHQSKQFKEKIEKINNLSIKSKLWASTSLIEAITKNKFRNISNGDDLVIDFKWYSTNINNDQVPIVDVSIDAQRRIWFSSLIDSWIQGQANLRISATSYVSQRFEYAKILYNKPHW